MSNIIIAYLIIILYIGVGYYIHNKCVEYTATDNKELYNLYSRLSNTLKITILIIIILFWLPIIIGDIFIAFLNWFAKTYNDMR